MLYFLDTNVISDFLNKTYNVRPRVLAMLEDKDNDIAICPIVYYEVVRGLKIVNSKNKLAEFLALYNSEDLVKLPFDYEVAEKAAEIYDQLHRGQQIEDNDIFIAASAIVNDCTLITANDKYFSRITALKVENWR